MSATLLLRLASQVQSWAGYRALYTRTVTYPVPTKSGVSGLLGACAGQRDLERIRSRFQLRVRVDRTNPAQTDLQVAIGPKPHERDAFARTIRVGTATARYIAPKQLTGTDQSSLANRDYLPAAEFICAITGTHEDVHAWRDHILDPVFMPYLGRKANPPTFPFLLGIHESNNPADVLTLIPTVTTRPRHGDRGIRTLRVHQVTGDYHQHHSTITTVTAPAVTSREEQLEWASQHLV